MAEFTCIVNCSDYVVWYVGDDPVPPNDFITKPNDPLPGLSNSKLQIRANYCEDTFIKCITFKIHDNNNSVHIKAMPAVLHILQGI